METCSRRSRIGSDLGDLAGGYLLGLLLESLTAEPPVVDGALVVLGQPVQVAECEGALAVGAQEAYLLIALVALGAVSLRGRGGHLGCGLGLHEWLLCLFGSEGGGVGSSGLGLGVLEAGRAHPVVAL